MPDDLTLLRQYEPVIRYNRGELFYPCSVEDFVAGSALFRRTDDEPEELAARGSLTLDRLAELGRVHVGDIIYLQQVDGPLTRKEYKAWRKRPDRVKFKTSSRFAAVGLLSRFVDAIMRLTLLLRGRVPGGHAAAAHNAYMNTPTKDDCHYYGHVTRDGGYLVLQYWYFYSMNDWRSNFGGVNDHESDWEQVTIFLTDDEEQKPAWVAFSSHDEVGDDLRRRWDDPDIEFVDGTHPVVYAGAGSHSGAYLKGEYLITAGVPLPDWLDSVRRAFLRILPWHEDDDSGAIGIPYIDYKRGDGVAVGPGQDKPWHPVLVTDDTPWVRDYRGLWGLDTHDVFGGERAPAGVRYERKGTVRQSWGQPVAWAGLDKEAPTDEWARGDLEAARKYLTQKLADTDLELAERREALRAARAAERAQGISPQDPTPAPRNWPRRSKRSGVGRWSCANNSKGSSWAWIHGLCRSSRSMPTCGIARSRSNRTRTSVGGCCACGPRRRRPSCWPLSACCCCSTPPGCSGRSCGSPSRCWSSKRSCAGVWPVC